MRLVNDADGITISNVILSRTASSAGEALNISFTVKVASSAAKGKVNGGMWVSINKNSIMGMSTYAYYQSGVVVNKGASLRFSVDFIMPNITGSYLPNPDSRNNLVGITISLENDGPYGNYAFGVLDAFTYLSSRMDPVIDSFAIIDLHPFNPSAHFGGYLRGVSDMHAFADIQLDSLDPTLVPTHSLTLQSNETTIYSVSNNTGVFQLPLTVIGLIVWTYTVTDSAGKSASTSGSFLVLPYTAPIISTLRAERYKTVTDDQGGVTYIAADDGELVRFTLSADVAAVAGLNAWTLDITYGVAESGETVTVTPLTGTDGGPDTIRKIDDRTLIEAVIPASADYDFSFVLSDFFGPVTPLVASVYKAGGYLNVEKHGVAVGMRSTGTPENPKFESAYPAHFYGGAFDGDGNEIGLSKYSTIDRVIVGEWEDARGKRPIYRRIVTLPQNSTKGAEVTVALGEDAIDFVVDVHGGYINSGGNFIPLPYTHATASYQIRLTVRSLSDNPVVAAIPGSGYSISDGGYVIVDYTLP